MKCKNCGKDIKLSELFGWIHLKINNGNVAFISCDKFETEAEPDYFNVYLEQIEK